MEGWNQGRRETRGRVEERREEVVARVAINGCCRRTQDEKKKPEGSQPATAKVEGDLRVKRVIN
jgi:hypothetical protein